MKRNVPEKKNLIRFLNNRYFKIKNENEYAEINKK